MNSILYNSRRAYLFIFLIFTVLLGLLFRTPIEAEPVSASIIGSIYTNTDETQTLETTVNVSLAVNGSYISSVAATESFTFSDISVEEGDVLTLYLDDNTEKAVTITKVSTGVDNSIIANNIYLDYLTLNSTGADAIGHSDLDIANNVDDSDILEFYESGYGLTVWNNYSALITEGTNVGTDMFIIEGDFVVSTNATITTETVSIYSDLYNYGTIYSGSISFFENNDQNILSTGIFDSLEYVLIDKDFGTVYLQSDVDFSIATISINGDSILDLNDYHLFGNSIEITSGSLIMNNGNISLDNGQGFIYLSINAYFEGNSNDLEFGILDISDNSTFVSSSGSLTLESLVVIEGGTFVHNNGTVVMKGPFNYVETDLYSTIEFNNFSIIDYEEDSNILELMVTETSTLRINGVLTLIGNGEDLVSIYSNGFEPFLIEMYGENSSVDVSNIIVYNSVIDAFEGSTVSIPINPLNSVNDGETSGWFRTGININGTVFVEDGSDSLGEGHEVIVAINGAQVTTAVTDSIGEFLVEDLDFQAGDIIFIYLNGNLDAYGTTVLKTDSNEETISVDIYQNYLTLDGRSENQLNKEDLLLGHTGDGTVGFSQSELNDNNLLSVNNGLYITFGSFVDLDLSAEIFGGLGVDGVVNFHEGDIILNGDLYIYGTLEIEGKIIFTGGANSTIGTGIFIPIPTDVEINGSTDVTLITETVIEGSLNVIDGSTLDCGYEQKIETSSNASFVDSYYTCYGTGEIDVNGDLLLNNSIFTLTDGYIRTINLELINSSSLISGREIYVEGDFSLSSDSTFIPNGGTVILQGPENNLNGNIPFYNLEKLVQHSYFESSITFSSGSTYPITGNLTLVGFDENNLLKILSSAEGQFTIEMLGFADFGQLEYLEIRNSIIYGLDSELEFPINPLNSFDLGNTLGWFSIDNITEPIIINSPSSDTIHKLSIPINIQIPEPMLSNSLRLRLVNGGTTYLFTLHDIEENTPGIINLNIDNVFEGDHVTSMSGLSEPKIPDGSYTLIVSYQDYLGNPLTFDFKTNITINRSYIEPEDNNEEENDDDDQEQEEENPNENENNVNEGNNTPYTQNNSNLSINTIAEQSSTFTSNQNPVSSPVPTNEITESNSNTKEIVEVNLDEENKDSERNKFEFSFPWWIILLIAFATILIYIKRRKESSYYTP